MEPSGIRRVWCQWKRLAREDRGAALVISAAVLVVLMGAAAMGTDLGWLYINGIRTQAAADAAALGGVVYLPDDEPTAQGVAISVAAANKYVDGSLGGDASIWSQQVPTNERQLEVEVTRPVDTFFLRVFGIDQVSIMRRAVAEYVPMFLLEGSVFLAKFSTPGSRSRTELPRDQDI